MSSLLQIEGLSTVFAAPEGMVRAVDGVSLSLDTGETLALVGESGCGKTVTALSILRLVTPPGRIAGGRILWDGVDLLGLPVSRIRRIRGNEISMIFQEPMTSLNPVFPVGEQIAEALRIHRGMNRREAAGEAVRALEEVKIPDARQRASDYPHQLSGGMQQRIMIAMALCCGPRLLMADEPTTALDVTIQAQILHLLRRLQEERGLAVLLITHDLGIVAQMASRLAVMYAGRIVEQGPVADVFREPLHPYTRGLMQSIPRYVPEGGGDAPHVLQAIEGTVPDLSRLPSGCTFEPRCPERLPECRETYPSAVSPRSGSEVSCFLHHPAGVADQNCEVS